MKSKSPKLIVMAGCNGSGKSTYSRFLVTGHLVPFDYDKIFMDIYSSKPDSELREVISHNLAFAQLEGLVNTSIACKSDFCYETNFHSDPMHWPNLFRKSGYQLEMFFFCLDSIEEAKRRVRIRYENGGHFVPENEVEKRFHLGYECLDKYFKEFDAIHIFDTSVYNSGPNHVLSLSAGNVDILGKYPAYLLEKLPEITMVKNTVNNV